MPALAPAEGCEPSAEDCYKTTSRGLAVLNSPLLNKGTAFPAAERKSLGLTGLLPPEISTLDTQVRRAYRQY
jgi:malate dehydrogenase (oxaloacetate-decarboxylating)